MEPSLSGRCARANVQAGLRRHTPNQHSNDERRKDVAELEHELEHNGDIRLGDKCLRRTSTARVFAQLRLHVRGLATDSPLAMAPNHEALIPIVSSYPY
jgi:hypothetical protein